MCKCVCLSPTEPAVASSDATNMECTITASPGGGREYVVNGRKWWTSGAGDPRCVVAIVMGVTNPDADRLHRHSMILVPMATKGVKKIRPLTVFGYNGMCVCVCVCVCAHVCYTCVCMYTNPPSCFMQSVCVCVTPCVYVYTNPPSFTSRASYTVRIITLGEDGGVSINISALYRLPCLVL